MRLLPGKHEDLNLFLDLMKGWVCWPMCVTHTWVGISAGSLPSPPHIGELQGRESQSQRRQTAPDMTSEALSLSL